jgi:hypothetical protein
VEQQIRVHRIQQKGQIRMTQATVQGSTRGPRLAAWGRAKILLMIAIGAPAVAWAIAVASKWFHGYPYALGVSVVGLALGLVALIMLLGAWRAQKAVDRMAAGDRFVWWEFSDEQWRAYLAAEKKREGRLWLWLAVAGMVLGGVLATIASFSGQPIGGSIPLTWLALCGGCTALTTTVGVFLQVVSYVDRKAKERMGGIVLIGRDGIFLSGDYHEMRQRVGLTYEPGPPVELRFIFRVPTGKSVSIVPIHVPVPVGQESEAKRVYMQLQR